MGGMGDRAAAYLGGDLLVAAPHRAYHEDKMKHTRPLLRVTILLLSAVLVRQPGRRGCAARAAPYPLPAA